VEGVDAEVQVDVLAAAVGKDARPRLVAAPGEEVVAALVQDDGAVAQLRPVLLAEDAEEALGVDHVQHQAAARLEGPGDGLQDPLVLGLGLEVAERGEEADDGVERLDVADVPHVALAPVDGHAAVEGLALGLAEEEGVDVLAGDVVAAAGQLHGVAAVSAVQIEDRGAGRDERGQAVHFSDGALERQQLVVLLQVARPEEARLLRVPGMRHGSDLIQLLHVGLMAGRFNEGTPGTSRTNTP